MSCREILNQKLYIIVCFSLFLSLSLCSLAWSGGDPSLFKNDSNQNEFNQQQTRDYKQNDPTTVQSTSQPLIVTQASSQATTSESPFSYDSMTEPGKLELGLIGGEPSGLSAKLWLSPTRAVDVALGWDVLGDDTNLQLHADYLFHEFRLFRPSSGELPVYAGMGARLRFGDEGRFGFRVPVGIQYIFENKVVSLFAEAAPVIDFIPEAKGDINFGFGVRFFFFQPDNQTRNPR